LGVVLHYFSKELRSQLAIKCEFINLPGAIINEPYHGQRYRHLLVGGAEIGTVSFFFMTGKDYRAHDTPDCRGIAAPLAGSIYGKRLEKTGMGLSQASGER
jgi:hypothetical protein